MIPLLARLIGPLQDDNRSTAEILEARYNYVNPRKRVLPRISTHIPYGL